MPDFVVSTAFRSKDEMSKVFKHMGLSANKFAQKTVKSFDKIERKSIGLKRIIGGILGAAAIQRSLGLLKQGIRGVVTEFIDFEDAITAAGAKFGILNRKSPAFKQLGKTAREVGATTEFTSAQAAEGLRFLAKAGWEANAAIKALPSFVNLATASEMEFARAADIATDVMGAFRLKSKDVDENLKQLVRVNDVLSKAVNMSNIDMEDLFETIKFAGPIAKTAGVSLEKFSAMAAFIGGAGIKGSLGGTALRTMFLNLAAPTDAIKGKLAEFNTEIKSVGEIDKNRKALKKLGIQLVDAKGALRDPIAILADLKRGFKKIGPAAQTAALKIIFGKRAVSGAAVSVEGATGALQDFEKSLLDAGGNSKKMAEFMRGSISKRLAELKSSAIELGFKFIDAFEKKIPGGIDAAVKAIRDFDVKNALDQIGKAAEVAGEFLTIIRDYKGVLLGAAAGFAALKVGVFVASMWQMVAVAKALIAVGGFKAMFAGLAGASAPLLAVALAVGGLAAGIFTLVTYWDDLGRALGWAMDDLQEWIQESPIAVAAILALINPFTLLLSIPATIKAKWGTISEFFQELFLDVLNFFNTLGAGITAVVKGIGGTLREIFTSPLEALNTLKEGIEGLLSLLSRLGGGALSTIKNAFGFGKGSGGAAPGFSAPPLIAPEDNAGITPPNKSYTEAAQQSVYFEGQLNVAGAPQGSTFDSSTTGAPPIRTEMLGANP